MVRKKKKEKEKGVFKREYIKYIEAVVYILAIIVGIFACNCGPIFIKMLPILFILGVVGRIIFDRPIVTTIFGFITATCIIRITGNLSLYDNLFISLFNSLNIALGELFGEYYLKSLKFFKKKLSKKKGAILNYIITGVILIVSIAVHLYTSGNYISYYKARANLNKYLKEVYENQEFSIIDAKYTFYKTKSYTFEVRNKTKEFNSNFIVLVTNDYAVYDEYIFNIQSQNNTKLNNEFDEFIKQINIDKDIDFKIGYLNSGDVKLIISKNVESVDSLQAKSFANVINEFINRLKEFKYYNKINNIEISLVDNGNKKNSLVSSFSIKDVQGVDNLYNYILDSFDTEFIN